MTTCPNGFAEALVTGHLDGELTQADAQRVRLHLEDCAHCRSLLDRLEEIREAAMTTEFAQPNDTQWDERPRGLADGALRGLGWIALVAWLVLVCAFGAWTVWTEAEGVLERIMIFGGVSAFVLLFLSVLVDRLRTARGDRYREVKR
jgi:predicted anti-sigma-YlaC factor YlaD